MAITKLTHKNDGTFDIYLLSSDTAPTTGVTNGSRLTIVNTGAKYVFLDGTWYAITDGAALT